ncbi:MAG: NADH-quinone oxidoreductase subunit K [Opitutaceae bacterium]|nr:NADH-quinone oxidoreductase subunit K [Opitutaceae bacterium]
MMWETAILVGLMFGGACFLILQASFVRILFGFILLSNAANLFLLAMSGRPDGKTAPVLQGGNGGPPVDPLPQALILTAIVIGFGVIAYMVVLLYRTFLDQHTANACELFDPRRERPKEDAS